MKPKGCGFLLTHEYDLSDMRPVNVEGGKGTVCRVWDMYVKSVWVWAATHYWVKDIHTICKPFWWFGGEQSVTHLSGCRQITIFLV